MIDPRMRRYFSKYRGPYALGFVLMIGASLVVMLPPAIIARTIDDLTAGTTTGRLATYGAMIIAILVLHQGRIVEEGTHQALLNSRGAYYRLYELQYKDQDIGVT